MKKLTILQTVTLFILFEINAPGKIRIITRQNPTTFVPMESAKLDLEAIKDFLFKQGHCQNDTDHIQSVQEAIKVYEILRQIETLMAMNNNFLKNIQDDCLTTIIKAIIQLKINAIGASHQNHQNHLRKALSHANSTRLTKFLTQQLVPTDDSRSSSTKINIHELTKVMHLKCLNLPKEIKERIEQRNAMIDMPFGQSIFDHAISQLKNFEKELKRKPQK